MVGAELMEVWSCWSRDWRAARASAVMGDAGRREAGAAGALLPGGGWR